MSEKSLEGGKTRGRPRTKPPKTEPAKKVGRPRGPNYKPAPAQRRAERGRPRIHPPSTGRLPTDPQHKRISLALSMRRCCWDMVEKLADAAGMPHSHYIEAKIIEPFLKGVGLPVPPAPLTRKEVAELEAEERRKRSQEYKERKRLEALKAQAGIGQAEVPNIIDRGGNPAP